MSTKTIIQSSADPAEGTLTRLVLRRFRAFEFQSIQLAPLTILVGPNNSGKSSILSAVRLLQQTLQSVDPSIPLALGPFGTFRDIVYGNKASDQVGLTIGSRHEGREYRVELSFGYRAQRRQIVQEEFNLFDDGVNAVIKMKSPRMAERPTLQKLADVPKADLQSLRVKFSHFFPRISYLLTQLPDKSDKRAVERLRSAESALMSEVRRIANTQYLGPNRDAPLRVYSFTGERPSLISSTGSGAADLLVADYFRRGTGKRKLSQSVSNWLSKAQISTELAIDAISDRHFELKFRHPITGELVNYADVGFGLSQILPVIVAGYHLQPGALLMVEQPEIHLHPRAQSELGDFLLNLYQRRVQAVVETHSEHLITRLQRHVAEGSISPEHVAVNYVYGAEDKKVVTRLNMNQDGIFTDTWPQGFFEERLGEALELARAPLRRNAEIE